jgi:hypothetical protein
MVLPLGGQETSVSEDLGGSVYGNALGVPGTLRQLQVLKRPPLMGVDRLVVAGWFRAAGW